MSYQSTMITRKARFWPEISRETVVLPTPPVLPVFTSLALLSAIICSLCSLFFCLALLLYGRTLPMLIFFVLSGVLGTGLFALYGARYLEMRNNLQQAQARYQEQLQETEKQLQLLHWRERQTRMEMSPPLSLPAGHVAAYEHLTMMPILSRSLDEQDQQLWARRRGDPDFLVVRIGLGQHSASFQIQEGQREQSSRIAPELAGLIECAHRLQQNYCALTVPLTVALYKRAPLALLSSAQTLPRARAVAQNLIAQLAYHHSPQDLRILVLAPQSQNLTWQWARALPHTQSLEAESTDEVGNDAHQVRTTIALGMNAVNEQLSALSRELGRRELLLKDLSPQAQLSSTQEKQAQFPHLVVIIDYFEAEDEANPAFYASILSLTSQKQGSSAFSPLQRPELTRALQQGEELGVSLVCISADAGAIPANSAALLQLNGASGTILSETTPLPSMPKQVSIRPIEETPEAGKPEPAEHLPEATLYQLQPDPPPAQICQQLDLYSTAVLHEFARRMQGLQALPDKRLDLRTQVDMRMLFTPPLELVGPQSFLRWNDALFRAPSFTGKSNPLLRIPIGIKCGDELQYLDLPKDGPHGLVIGQNGSGKNELLQTLLLTLALAYRPAEIAFLLIDQGTGQALAPLRTLPHTLGYLDPDPSTALVQRFLTMLHAELQGRESRLREGKGFPRLLILINEFLALTEQGEKLLDELVALTNASRELGIHLLFAAESPLSGETGNLAPSRRYQQIRDLVQYRLSLRCGSVEESRAVIARDDAAFLPASLPGRAYLLHKDHQLDLFQAALATQLIMQEPARLLPKHEPSTDKDVAALVTAPIREI